jgi:hypothetical protein
MVYIFLFSFLLKVVGPQIPLYEPLNVQIKSYDYTVLETFSSYIHKTAEHLEIEVEDWYFHFNISHSCHCIKNVFQSQLGNSLYKV